jgi:DNA polymerase-3 subunit gamma/tau
MVPLGGHSKPAGSAGSAETAEAAVVAATPQAASAAAPTSQHSGVRAMGDPAPETISLDDLLETWPDLLDDLLESDREAWNAVRQVQPLSLEGEMLAVGLASQTDLDAFKKSGAGPLREALAGAFGINVKYVPKPLPEGVRPMFADREGGDDSPQEPSLTAEPEYERVPEPVVVAEPEVVPVFVPEPEPEPEPEPGPEPGPEPEPEPEPVFVPEPEPAASAPAEPETPAQPSAPVALAVPDTTREKPKPRETPGFTRYGEAVVREVLGARFIEERPLPEGFER